jgi:hypothetical protein
MSNTTNYDNTNNEMRNEPDSATSDNALCLVESLASKRVSRRGLLGVAGQGVLGFAALALFQSSASPVSAFAGGGRTKLERMMPGARELGARPGAGGHGKIKSLAAPVVKVPVYLAQPFWGDGDFGGQQNYETIQAGRRLQINKTVQSADIDGDGQDELIGRNSSGILVNQFDGATGQWQTMTSGPTLSDYSLGTGLFGVKFGWEQPCYYQTIQTGKINGGSKAMLIARDNEGIKAWEFAPYPNNPRQGIWTALPDGPAWHDFTLSHPLTTAWNQADCYQTIQCADIDGDGRDELLGRSQDPASYQTGSAGLQVWKFDGSNWSQMPSLTTMSDANGWNQPQQYSTIQCADIDGDGIAEVIGRDSTGLHVWKYYPNNGGWALGITQSDFSDANGWNAAPYYSTIQCADVDGDGQAEIVARAASGIVVYHHNKSTGQLDLQSTFPDLADAHGWGAEENYATIQCADFNGDGKAELIARSVYGIIGYAYNGSAWTQIADGPGWADDKNTSPDSTAWNQPQYYQTIQSAHVKTALGTRSILLGKAAINVQSWTFNGGWQQSTLQFPQFVSDGVPGSNADQQAKAYQHINANLTGVDPNQDIRAQYGTLDTSGISTWKSQLTDNTELTMSPPSGVSTSNPDNWTPVRNQIKLELDMVSNVLTVQTNMKIWYATQLGLNLATLNKVNGYLHADTTYTDNTNTLSIASVFIAVFAAAINIVAAVAAPELIPEEILALNITTQIMGAASSALTLIPTTDGGIDAGQPASLTFAEFSGALSDWAENVITSYDGNVQAIVQDYGLLLVNGATDVKWDTSAADAAMVSAQSSYELTLWQAMAPYVWFAGQGLSFPPGYDSDSYGTQVTIPSQVTVDYWINTDPNNFRTYPTLKTLQYLFGTFSPSAYNVILGGNGWTGLAGYWFGPTPPNVSVTEAIFKPVHRITVTPSLVRNVNTGILEMTMLVYNAGTETETDIELTSVKLGSGNPALGLPAAKLQLRPDQSHEQQFFFPANSGIAGQTVVLGVSGKHKGGTFGGSYRVKIP